MLAAEIAEHRAEISFRNTDDYEVSILRTAPKYVSAIAAKAFRHVQSKQFSGSVCLNPVASSNGNLCSGNLIPEYDALSILWVRM